ncbi:MAG: thioredoxin domain-containing protein [bacterium]
MRRLVYLLIVVIFAAPFFLQPYLRYKDSKKVQYTELPRNGKPTFLEFYSRSCEVCRMMKPGIHKLRGEFRVKVNFLLLDVDAPSSEKLASRFDIYSLPSIHLFSPDGTPLRSFEGLVGIRTLRMELEILSRSANEK